MRNQIISYLCLCALLLAVFFILSFNSGFGYVYVQWLGWQVQSNMLVMLLALFVCVAVVVMLWRFLRKVLRRKMQKYTVPKSFRELHPYERMGIVWLLHGERAEQEKIIATYQESTLLYSLIQAKFCIAQGQTEQAKQWLKQIQNPLFELAELLKIDIALAEKRYAEALDRLEFLTVQPLSTWLKPVEAAYQIELQEKWLLLSQTCPWWIFKASHQPQFQCEQQQVWLHALLAQSEQASDEAQRLFLDWARQRLNDGAQSDIQENIILLKLMCQFHVFDAETAQFAQQLLAQRFIPEVLYIWLDKSLNQPVDIQVLDAQVQNWKVQYPAQPSLSFAQWHIDQRQHKFAEADALLNQFPDDAYMAYLRIQNTLQASEMLQHDLKVLLHYSKQDFKFDL